MPGEVPTVLWICGPSGAGKSVAGWALFQTLAADGVCAACVDIDQLGMLYPASDDDPARHRLKEAALLELIPGYAAAGARIIVVTGVVDPDSGPTVVLGSDLDVTVCLLLADPATLRERILARGWDEADVDEAVAEDMVLRGATFVDATLDTAGLSVVETADRLRPLVRLGGWRRVGSPSVACSPAETGVLVVTGPRAVGSSTAAFGTAMARWQADLRTGFVDLQQLSFIAGPGSGRSGHPELATTQLAAMHAFFAARGAEVLVVSGHLSVGDRDALRAALPAAQVTVLRLRADGATIEAQVRQRGTGSAARLAGDDLLGADVDYQATVVAAALVEQEHLDVSAKDDIVLDVTGRTPDEVVADIERLLASRAVGDQ